MTYDARAVRDLFEKWGREEIVGDPGEMQSRWTVRHVNHLVLDRWLPSEGAALDAGSGHGIETVRMARQGLTVTALDVSDSLLDHARRRVELTGVRDRITFVRADLTEPLPLPAEHFDVCLALTGVISHTGARHREAMADLVACCRRGGLVIVGVDSYYGKIHQYLLEGRLDDAEHLADTHFTSTVSDAFEDYCFTPQEVTDLLAALGCAPLQLIAAPALAPYGYVGATDDAMRRGLALERRFLGVPELAGAGEQLIGVFRKERRG
jgi:SAM-dependent methyltransferase